MNHSELLAGAAAASINPMTPSQAERELLKLLKNSKVAARIAAIRATAEEAVVERLVYTKEVAMTESRSATLLRS